jgi:hypothetical protein
MAVPAVEAHAADVVEVAELDRLFDELVLLGRPRRAHERKHEPPGKKDQGQNAGK